MRRVYLRVLSPYRLLWLLLLPKQEGYHVYSQHTTRSLLHILSIRGLWLDESSVWSLAAIFGSACAAAGEGERNSPSAPGWNSWPYARQAQLHMIKEDIPNATNDNSNSSFIKSSLDLSLTSSCFCLCFISYFLCFVFVFL